MTSTVMQEDQEKTMAPDATDGDEGASELAAVTCWQADPSDGSDDLSFSDATASLGLTEPLLGMFAHAAAWGDIDGDLLPDLLVGTFTDRPAEEYERRGATEPAPDRLLLQREDGFVVHDGFPQTYGRTSGAAFADLDSDGDLDLVLARNVRASQDLAATTVFENVDGSFRAADSGIAVDLGGRSIGVLDYDGDGALDLFIAEDRHRGGHSRLYHNDGGLRFSDVTTAAGFPDMLAGLGVATADVDGDDDVDIFIAGDNRLFLDVGDQFVEAATGSFRWPPVGDEDDPAGAAFGDVDRDGRMDLVIGQHFNSTVDFDVPAPVRLFLNHTEPDGEVTFDEITDAAGLVPLPTKAPHVEIVDMDNDGWPDIVTSASSAGGTRPAVFRGLGTEEGVPRFEAPKELGDAQYWVAAPAADADLDGRLDLFLVEFEPSLPSYLLHNESASGNWLEVSVGDEDGGGIGAQVFVYAPATDRLLGSAGITVSRGYSAGVPAIAHIGLGDTDTVDVVVHLPGGREYSINDVLANRHIRLPGGCA